METTTYSSLLRLRKISYILAILFVLAGCTKNKDEQPNTSQSESITVSTDGSFGVVGYNETKIKSLTVTNNEPNAQSVIPVVTGLNAASFSVTNYSGCDNLLPGKSCLVKVVFSGRDKSVGSYSATLLLGSEVINLSATIETGAGLAYTLKVGNQEMDTTMPVNLGVVAGKNYKVLWLRIKNSSPIAGNLGTLTISNSTDYQILHNTCQNLILKPDQSCQAAIALRGDNSAQIKSAVVSFDTLSVNTEFASEQVVYEPALTVVDVDIQVGIVTYVGQNIIKVIKFKNEGLSAGSLNNLDLPDDYTLGSNNCNNVLPGKTCIIRLIYKNTSTEYGISTTTLNIGVSTINATVDFQSKPSNIGSVSLTIPQIITTNQCVMASIEVLEKSGVAFKQSAITPISVSVPVYSDNNCINQAGPVLEAYANTSNFYVKLGSPQTINLTATVLTQSDSKTISFFNPLSVPASAVGIVNEGKNLLISGGSGNYQLSIQSGTASFNGSILTGTATGVVNVLVHDNVTGENGSIPVTIYSHLNLSTNLVGLTNQGITIPTTGGSNNYQYSILSGSGTLSSGVLTSSSAGPVSVQVIDNITGENISTIITVYNPLSLSANLVGLVNNPLAIPVTGGSNNYQYSILSGSGTITGGSLTSSVTGSVSVQVQDNITRENISTTVTVYSHLSLSSTLVGLINQGITIPASGGSGNYQYSILSGTGTLNAGVLTKSAAGVVNVQVHDNITGQNVSTVVTVYNPLNLSKTLVGLINDPLTIPVSGGSGNYQYSILLGSGILNSGNLTSTTAGTVSVQVHDNITGQNISTTATIYSHLNLAATLVAIVNEGLSIPITGGSGNYQYSIQSGSGSITSGSLTSSVVGSVTVKVQDNITGENVTSVVSVYSRLSLAATLDGIVNVNLTIPVTGGSGNYQYSIQSGSGTLTNGVLNSLVAGSVTVRVQDNITGEIKNTVVTVNSSLVSTGCTGTVSYDQSCDLLVSGGKTPYQITASSGVVTNGVYLSGACGTEDSKVVSIQITDNLGQVLNKNINVSCAYNYWGSGADGNLNTAGNVNLCDGSTDGEMCIVQYNNLTINSGHTVTINVRRRGLIVYVKGDAVINGSLSMTARGASGQPEAYSVGGNGIQLVRKTAAGTAANGSLSSMTGAMSSTNFTATESKQLSYASGNKIYRFSQYGSGGGQNGSICPYQGTGGGSYGLSNNTELAILGTGGGAQGGNSAESCSWGRAGYGSQGTIFSGGSGGAGRCADRGGGDATAWGGTGGSGAVAAHVDNQAAGGAGNPAGAPGPSTVSAETGTGGLLILVVKGNLTINGSLQSNGRAGGRGCIGLNSYSSHRGAGGGGSGGGSILVLYGGNATNNGSIQAVGGSGGVGCGGAFAVGQYGGSGGTGATLLEKVLK